MGHFLFCVVNRYDPQKVKKRGIEKNQALESISWIEIKRAFAAQRAHGLSVAPAQMIFELSV